MGVYINGREMPKACLACDFCNPFTEEPYCRRLMKVTPKTTTLPDCPLIAVPGPHGRLIDGSANALILEKKLEEANADFMTNLDDEYLEGVRDGISECVKTIWFAPTVIPAEEG